MFGIFFIWETLKMKGTDIPIRNYSNKSESFQSTMAHVSHRGIGINLYLVPDKQKWIKYRLMPQCQRFKQTRTERIIISVTMYFLLIHLHPTNKLHHFTIFSNKINHEGSRSPFQMFRMKNNIFRQRWYSRHRTPIRKFAHEINLRHCNQRSTQKDQNIMYGPGERKKYPITKIKLRSSFRSVA